MNADTAVHSRYGWVIVGAMLTVQTVSSGFGFYNMSVYMTELAKLLQQPLAGISLSVTLFFVVGGISGMFVARLLERFHVRWIMACSALACGLCLAAVSLADAVWHIYVLFALFGAVNTGVSLVVATTLITWWFPGANRSIALSIASTGLSLGGILITPFCAYLFNTYGLAPTMPWIGLAFAVVVVPVALLVVRPPAEREVAVIAQGAPPAVAGMSYARAIRSRFFVLLALGYLLCMGAQVGGIAHLYNLVEEIAGFALAAQAVQVLTLCSILGRFAGGWIVTRVAARWFTLCNLLLQMTGLLVLSQAESRGLILGGAAIFGFSVGNLLMMQPLWLAEAFPGKIYPRLFALANAVSVAGVAAGPFLMGVAYDYASYELAYLSAMVVSSAALLVVLAAGHRPAQAGTGESY
ncbi:MAG: MFS transporter [Pseudomonadota bacterium]